MANSIYTIHVLPTKVYFRHDSCLLEQFLLGSNSVLIWYQHDYDYLFGVSLATRVKSSEQIGNFCWSDNCLHSILFNEFHWCWDTWDALYLWLGVYWHCQCLYYSPLLFGSKRHLHQDSQPDPLKKDKKSQKEKDLENYKTKVKTNRWKI